MDISLTSVLALFSLLILSSGLYFLAARIKVPYTVLLVLVGMGLAAVINIPVLEPTLGFIDDIKLTPELLFYVFLPILIFESGFNTNIRKLLTSVWTISLLSVVGLLISAFAIAGALFFVLPMFGVHIPFVVALLFGSIISATDPVAVLSLFKQVGAPRRLSIIFEGESLFNDGTAVALFLVILGIATDGFHGALTVVEGTGLFLAMVAGGIAIGLLAGVLFSSLLRKASGSDAVIATILLISAHAVFVGCELINELHFAGLHVSSIIATTICSLFLGNYARHLLTHDVDHYVHKAVEHGAFMANSLVFILSGLLFASSNVPVAKLWLPALVTVFVVAACRVISVFLVTTSINKFIPKERIERSWELLLSWASIRGALAIIVALLIPKDLTVEGWNLPYSVHELVLALTIGCILATMFIKAPLVSYFIRKMGIDRPSPLQIANSLDARMLQLRNESRHLDDQRIRTTGNWHASASAHLAARVDQLTAERDAFAKKHGTEVFESSLLLKAVSLQRSEARELFRNGEVDETVYRRILGILNLQIEAIEYGHFAEMDSEVHMDRKDVFDRFMESVSHFKWTSPADEKSISSRYQYHRAQILLTEYVLTQLRTIHHQHDNPVFLPSVYQKVTEQFEGYYADHRRKLEALSNYDDPVLLEVAAELAVRKLRASHDQALRDIRHRGVAEDLVDITDESVEQRSANKSSRLRRQSESPKVG